MKDPVKVELLKALNIYVFDSASNDNFLLVRNGITVPYNSEDFMFFLDDYLITDILKKFKDELDMNNDEYIYEEEEEEEEEEEWDDEDCWMDCPMGDMDMSWTKKRIEGDTELIDDYTEYNYIEELPPTQYHDNNIVFKKKNIRDNLTKKGLLYL